MDVEEEDGREKEGEEGKDRRDLRVACQWITKAFCLLGIHSFVHSGSSKLSGSRMRLVADPNRRILSAILFLMESRRP